MQSVTAVVIDDERANVNLLVQLLEKFCPLINVIGQATSKADAIALIDELLPQLIFLDIQLDIGTGFDVLKEASHQESRVIFVTSFDEYAIQAFKYNAVDYVLKPVGVEELVLAVNKACKEIDREQYTDRQKLDDVSNSVMQADKQFDFIAIPSLDKIEFVKLDDIIYFESDGRYTTLYLTNKETIVACKNIGEYEKILDEQVFFRIHHSYLVNLTHALNINKSAGNYCEMINGKSLPVSRRRQDLLLKHLKIK